MQKFKIIQSLAVTSHPSMPEDVRALSEAYVLDYLKLLPFVPLTKTEKSNLSKMAISSGNQKILEAIAPFINTETKEEIDLLDDIKYPEQNIYEITDNAILHWSGNPTNILIDSWISQNGARPAKMFDVLTSSCKYYPDTTPALVKLFAEHDFIWTIPLTYEQELMMARTRLNQEYSVAGDASRALDSRLKTVISTKAWKEAYDRHSSWQGLVALLLFVSKDVVAECLKKNGVEYLRLNFATGHEFIKFMNALPKGGVFRGMAVKDATESLRLHMHNKGIEGATTRKMKNEMKLGGKPNPRSGPWMANTPEALAKKAQRKAKKDARMKLNQ
jgi:hypothetical protein